MFVQGTMCKAKLPKRQYSLVFLAKCLKSELSYVDTNIIITVNDRFITNVLIGNLINLSG